jgi:integrase/recombinase XerD
MSVPSLLESFHQHLRARGLRPLTQERYLYGAQRLQRHAGTPLEAISGADGYAFLVHVGGELGLSASWYNVLFTSVVRWFEFRSQVVDLKGLRPQRRAPAPPRAWSAVDVGRLLGAVANTRYRLALRLCYATGLRLSEMLHLRVSDISRDEPLLWVEDQKGGGSRQVLLLPSLRGELQDYWRQWRPRGFLFERRPGHDPQPMSVATIRRAFHQARQAAGITAPGTPHTLRHSCATHLLRAGVDVFTLQRLLGHRSLASTTRYLSPATLATHPTQVDLLARLDALPGERP